MVIISDDPLKYSISNKGLKILEKEVISWEEIRNETYYFCIYPRFFIPKYLIPFEIYPKEFMKVEQKNFLKPILENVSYNKKQFGIPNYIKGLTDNSIEQIRSISGRKIKIRVFPNASNENINSFKIKLSCYPFYWRETLDSNHPDIKNLIEDLEKLKIEQLIESKILNELDLSLKDLNLKIYWDQAIEKWILEIISIKIDIIDMFFKKLSQIKYELDSFIEKPEQQISLKFFDRYNKEWDLKIKINLKFSKELSKIIFMQYLSSKIVHDLKELSNINNYIKEIHQDFCKAFSTDFLIPDPEEIKEFLWLSQNFEAAYILMYEEDFNNV